MQHGWKRASAMIVLVLASGLALMAAPLHAAGRTVRMGSTTGTLMQAETNTLTLAPDPNQRCFPETGFCISGRIREFWEQNGGLPVFGFPTSAQQPERVEAGTYEAQHFQRHRMELHPENARPYDVLLGRLGAEQVQQTRVASLSEEPAAGCLLFKQTQHKVCGAFAQAWQRDGLEFDGQPGKSFDESLALFGLPVTAPMTVRLSDGKPHQVQYFERARFEFHPENAVPYNVLFGLLDNEARSGGAPARPAVLLPAPLYFLYDSQIVRLERDGLTQKIVVDERGNGEITTFSASFDGSSLAYVLKTTSGYKLIRADAAGANRVEAFTSPNEISTLRWSPSGTRMVVHVGELNVDTQGNLFMIATSGGQARLLLPDNNKSGPHLAYLPVSWSPDERHVLINAVVKQSEGCVPMMFSMGTEEVRDLPAPNGERLACGGAWSPKGLLLVSVMPSGSFASAGLWQADVNTNQIAPFVAEQTAFGYNLFSFVQPTASGAISAFMAKTNVLPRLGDTRPINYAPYVIQADATERRQLGTVAFDLLDILGWAPDGSGFLLRGVTGNPIVPKTVWVPLDGGAPYEINNASAAVSWGR